jgi:hypothetical protein
MVNQLPKSVTSRLSFSSDPILQPLIDSDLPAIPSPQIIAALHQHVSYTLGDTHLTVEERRDLVMAQAMISNWICESNIAPSA